MRTLTDCCASTSPKGPISASTVPTRLQPWPPPSTRGPERRLIGRHPQRRLTGFSYQPTKIVLRRPLESALDTIAKLAAEGIPVVGHVGLIPARATWTGGFKAVGKTAASALHVYEHVKALESAGAVAAEIEVVPARVATEISKRT